MDLKRKTIMGTPAKSNNFTSEITVDTNDSYALNILLVDVDRDYCGMILKNFASRNGIVNLKIAHSVLEACAIIGAYIPDLIIVNYLSLKDKGSELLFSDKNTNPYPFIITSNDEDQKIYMYAKMVGALDCIVKSEKTSANMFQIVKNVLYKSNNIVEQKIVKNENKNSQAQLRQLQRLEILGTLAGGIAHDFNNILTPILGYTDLTLDELPVDSRLYGFLEHVKKASQRARDLVKQILYFTTNVRCERKPIQLDSVIKEAAQLLKASLPSTININLDIKDKDAFVLANSTEIHQVIMNLCTNAYYAMRQHGGSLELLLDTVQLPAEIAIKMPDPDRRAYVKIVAKDTGEGINRTNLKKIFEPFFTTKPVGEGTGLGLSQVYEIIKGHGGAIIAESEINKGTTFTIYLPQVQAIDQENSLKDDANPKGNESILYVDDDEEIVVLLKQALECLGYKVNAKTSSLEALGEFYAYPDKFDLVITDLTMPGMTGDQLSTRLLKIRPDIPIILLSGYSEKFTTEDSKRLGISEFIMKPIVSNDLGRVVRRVMEGHQKIEARVQMGGQEAVNLPANTL
ncbi:MAG: response regulator [Candidatus Anammoxibacter sp.]